MHIKLTAALLAAVSLSACAGMTPTGTNAVITNPATTGTPLSTDVTSDLPRNARPLHYAIEVRPDAQNLTFSGRESVTVEELQIAGRHCRASGKPISFERDARLCPQCGEAYLKDQVPKKCLTCQAELGTRAREA